MSSSDFHPTGIIGVRALLAAASLGLLTGCSMLPLSVQSRVVAMIMEVTKEEVASVMQEASTRHSLDAHWVARSANGSLEVGLGRISTSMSVVFRRINGRWVEDPDSVRNWSSSSEWGPPPPPPFAY